MKTADQIRDEFFSFFKEKNHTVVPSDSLVPGNDPTLLFTNAGMNQFKDVFLSQGTRDYNRAVNTQKCLRVSGKHNDLDEVGYDTYHHTFFEMLGNWSFGDYFKKEAIGWAWELLTDVWGFDPDRLYATVHEGDEKLGLAADEEAAAYWKSETTMKPEHVLFFDSKDNFWMMGDTGPCGPCSEIHIDLRPDAERKMVPGTSLVNGDDARIMEIWNLVFIQYNALPGGGLEPLDAQHVDTGMGFERVVAVLQEKSSNYDTDLFLPVLNRVAELSPLEDLNSYDEPGGDHDDAAAERRRVAMRVIADHARTVAFAIADGAVPGNVGRGYVIRRILRRAVRYGYQTLDLTEPFLFRVIEAVRETMAGQFPELDRNLDYVERVVRAEEESFLETLGTGLQYFETIAPYIREFASESDHQETRARLQKDRIAMDLLSKAYTDERDPQAIVEAFAGIAEKQLLSGEIGFLLHDTYGFPVDLTELMAREEDLSVDMERYSALMEKQKNRARASASFRIGNDASDEWTVVSQGDDSEFTGYTSTSADDTVVRAYRAVEGPGGEQQFEIVLDQTPFYAESGGQVGDIGTLSTADETIHVLDTVKSGKKSGTKFENRIVHVVDRLPSDFAQSFQARVDTERRIRIVKHHSATHLVHAALREVLGPHVAQKGSLVAPDHLRFDFSHFERVSPEELRRIEDRVNEVIQLNVPRGEEVDIPIEEALARGAMALFGEKYGETVRMITFDPDYSVELCGGIHVEATGQIGLFKFVSEGSVAAGIRRIEAVSGREAIDYLHNELDELHRVRGQFKSLQRPSDEEVSDLLSANRKLEKKLSALRLKALSGDLDRLIENAQMIGDVRLVVGEIAGVDMNALRALTETLREKVGEGTVGVIGTADSDEGKVYLASCVSDDLIEERKLNAGKLVGILAKELGGGGGGRAELATAGGRMPEKLSAVLQSTAEIVGRLLG